MTTIEDVDCILERLIYHSSYEAPKVMLPKEVSQAQTPFETQYSLMDDELII